MKRIRIPKCTIRKVSGVIAPRFPVSIPSGSTQPCCFPVHVHRRFFSDKPSDESNDSKASVGSRTGTTATKAPFQASTSTPEKKSAQDQNEDVGVDSETVLTELNKALENEEREKVDTKDVEKGTAGLLWFSDVFPTQIANWDFRPWLTSTNHEKVIPKLMPKQVKIEKMVPRPRDGGVFVYFKASPEFVRVIRRSENKEKSNEKKKIHDLVCMAIERYSKSHSVRAFLCPYPIRAFQVQ